MSSDQVSVSDSGASEEEYDRRRELLYNIVKENVQHIACKIKNCSENLQNLARDMDNVSKRVTVVQKHSLITENATQPEETMSPDT